MTETGIGRDHEVYLPVPSDTILRHEIEVRELIVDLQRSGI